MKRSVFIVILLGLVGVHSVVAQGDIESIVDTIAGDQDDTNYSIENIINEITNETDPVLPKEPTKVIVPTPVPEKPKIPTQPKISEKPKLISIPQATFVPPQYDNISVASVKNNTSPSKTNTDKMVNSKTNGNTTETGDSELSLNLLEFYPTIQSQCRIEGEKIIRCQFGVDYRKDKIDGLLDTYFNQTDHTGKELDLISEQVYLLSHKLPADQSRQETNSAFMIEYAHYRIELYKSINK